MTEPQRQSSLAIIKAIGGFLLPYKKTLMAAAMALIFTAVITLSLGRGLQQLIDSGFATGSIIALQQALTFLAVLIALMAGGIFVRFYLVSWLGERVSADLRIAVFNHVTTLEPNYFETNRSSEIISRLTTDTTLLQSIIGSSLSMALRSSLMFIGALGLLITTNWQLTAVVFIAAPIVLAPIILIGRHVRRLSKSSQHAIAAVGSRAGEVIEQIKTVQSYTMEDYERQAFKDEVEAAFTIGKQRVRQRAMLITAVISLVFSAIAIMLWIGGNDVINGTMSGGELAAFIFYAILMASAMATLSEVYGEVLRAVGAAERLLELLQVQANITVPNHAQPLHTATMTVDFSEVSFRYPSRPDTLALKTINLHIKRGTSLALVGASGAGKSTIFELLQRFYDPEQGRITLNGIDIRQLTPQQLRQKMALVSQQPVLFNNDVYYNIGYGSPDASKAQIIAAARAAHADEFITQLTSGYNSHLGERGVRLSGGQRQRIVIARAILNNPDILLLDEATSALDAESEAKVQQALEELMQHRTTIIIAHRLSTILHADQIALIDNGQIIALGKHHELFEDSADYRRLVELQFNHSHL